MDKPIILCLSGWAQKPESLRPVFADFSSKFQIINFDYSQFCSADDCFLALQKLSIKPAIIVGWSLGGQIATRLIAEKLFKPKLLILIAAPFQFVKSPKISAAMPKNTFEDFYNNFIRNSHQTLEKFSLLSMLGSAKRSKELARNLTVDDKNYPGLTFWLAELGRFSCHNLNFDNFPKTLILQGEGDLVVNVAQAKTFAKNIPNSDLKILPNCGHCPHISNLDEVKKIVGELIKT